MILTILFCTAEQVVFCEENPPQINAITAVVIEESTGRILYNKNATQKRSIASTTKIMTALVALENADLDEQVKVSKRAAGIGGSVMGLRTDDNYTLKELLYAMLMISGNDAAVAIAEHVGGSVEEFAAMMNKRARSLGADDSNFVTPHGLDSTNQYSTAYDVALITREALRNPVFAEIVSTYSSYIPGHSLYNTNELLGAYPGLDGVKTGYTGKAGRCLVTTAKKDGMRVISVVLGSPTRNARAGATREILDYTFDNYKMTKILDTGDILASIPVYRGVIERVNLIAGEGIVLPMKEQEKDRLQIKKVTPELLKAPVYAGSETGFIEYRLDGEVVGRIALTISDNIRRKSYFDYLKSVIGSWSRMMKEGIFADVLS
ncbi:MAG TPA: D-alanyl-D-alanine carboxypeptidase family protein [Clostridia bacterium]|nr:D-alanyl-D-alanine carboxypeptidase family protein [Clostridia bacterium]